MRMLIDGEWRDVWYDTTAAVAPGATKRFSVGDGRGQRGTD
jgi:hypothetical protein